MIGAEELARTSPDSLGRWGKVTDDEGTYGVYIRQENDLRACFIITTVADAEAMRDAFAEVARRLSGEVRTPTVAVTIKLSGPIWNFVAETLAYDPAKNEWASVEDTIVAVLQDIYESGQETPER